MSVALGYIVAIVVSLIGTASALYMAYIVHVVLRPRLAEERGRVPRYLRWLINFQVTMLLLLALSSTWITFEAGSRLFDRLHQ
jgi:hypothetical protein